MSTFDELAASAKDAFIVLNRATRIEYVGGDFWAIDDEHREHPLVPRLRAASMASMTTDPPGVDTRPVNVELVDRLKEERRANEAMRSFLIELEDICRKKGMGDEVVGRNVLAWLRDHVTESSNPPSK